MRFCIVVGPAVMPFPFRVEGKEDYSSTPAVVRTRHRTVSSGDASGDDADMSEETEEAEESEEEGMMTQELRAAASFYDHG